MFIKVRRVRFSYFTEYGLVFCVDFCVEKMTAGIYTEKVIIYKNAAVFYLSFGYRG